MNILLLEPNYKNKYPPLGLMKIATFHKNNGDQIFFSKGINKNLCDKNWGRIYINSLFTFEWYATKKMIDFAISLTENKNIIYLGGIAATLLHDEIKLEYSEINIVKGLLNESGKLNLPNDASIDYLTPDYSILEQIEYKYPTSDAYFTYATRGCGMNCSFCAVQRLEPNYTEYISIKNQIKNINDQCGEKRNLMLMDNNVLKSPRLNDIIQDIVDLGFAKNAKFVNPKTGKKIKRHVDFNQGLDANFLTKDKARLLSRLELDPVRIAFDHIKQKDKYIKAIRTCFDAGLRSFSNYILYNTNEASWKGQSYGSDTPEDLYNRLKFNVNLCEELNGELLGSGSNEKVYIYSFPMRYIPLNDKDRGYIGDNWDKKSLRAIQVFITPTQGKGVPSKTFFEASFGKSIEDFLLYLYFPEKVLIRRGKYTPPKKNKSTSIAILAKYKKFIFNQNFIKEWLSIYRNSQKEISWENFKNNYIKCNTFTFDTYLKIRNPLEKSLYLYYLSSTSFKQNYQKLPINEKIFIDNFFKTTGIYLYQLIQEETTAKHAVVKT